MRTDRTFGGAREVCYVKTSPKLRVFFSGGGCHFFFWDTSALFLCCSHMDQNFDVSYSWMRLSRLAQIPVSCVVVVNGRCFVLHTPLSSLFPFSGRIVEVWKIVGWGIGRIV